MSWEGKERRRVKQDSVERDRLLTRLDANVEFLVTGHKNTVQALMDHAKADDAKFKELETRFDKKEKEDMLFYGKIYGGSAVVAAISGLLVKALIK